MHNRIDIDHRHSLAISREIGERLQASLRVEPELPPSIRNWIERFRELDDQSPSIASTMERGAENEPRTSERSAETAARTRLGWWRRKNKERQESLDNHGAISAMRALYRYVKRVFNLDREDHHWESASWRGIGDRV